jgi:AraC family transcriptional regulator, melibiose operon regulatory protein
MENKLHILNGYSDELFPINICVVRKYSDLPIGSGFKSLHWHEDLQFVLCTKGYVNYQVNGIEYKLKEKEALFINKGALHMSNDMSEDGEYVTLTFPEELLFFFKESRMKYKYVWPYTRMDFLRCYEIKEKNQIIKCLYDIYNIHLKGSDMIEYDVSILITMIWRHLVKSLSKIIYVFLTIFLYLLKCPQSLILSALRAFCFCGKPHISRSIFLYFLYQTWLKSW